MLKLYKADLRIQEGVYGFGEIHLLHRKSFNENEFKAQCAEAALKVRSSLGKDPVSFDNAPQAFRDAMVSLFGYTLADFQVSIGVGLSGAGQSP